MRVPALWRNRDFTVLWSGRAVSELGSAMSFVALPLLTLTVGSPTDAGLVLATATIGQLVVALYAGAVTDRVSRRLAMTASVLVRAVGYGSLAAASATGAITLGQLYAVAAIVGLAGPFFSAAETAAIRAVVPPEQLPSAYSQNQVRSMTAELSGAPVGGALYAVSHALPFAADAVSFLLEAVALRSIRADLAAPGRSERRAVWHDIGSGLSFIWRHPFLRVALLAGGIINFAALCPVLLLTLHDRHIAPSLIGATLSALTVAGLIGALAAPVVTKRVAPGRIIIAASWVLVGTLAVMTVASSTLLMLAALIAGVTVVPAIGILLSSYETAVTPNEMIGRVSAAGSFLATAAIPAGQAVGGALYAAGGPRLAFAVFGSAVLVGALLLTGSNAVREIRPGDAPAPETAAETVTVSQAQGARIGNPPTGSRP